MGSLDGAGTPLDGAQEGRAQACAAKPENVRQV